MAAGDVVNTAARLQTVGAGRRDPRRRGHAPGDGARDRVPGWPIPWQAKGKAAPDRRLGGGRGAIPLRHRHHPSGRHRARRARAGARPPPGRPRSGATSGRATARDARRRAGHREEPLGARALRPHRRDAGPDHLATGPVPALRRRRELLGARRDGQGRGGHPGDGHRWRGRGQGGPERHRADRGGGRAALGRTPPAPPDRADPGARRRLGGDGGRARCLASLPRGPRRAPPDRPGVRGSALGRRRPPRLPRRADRLDARRPTPGGVHGEAGAPRPSAGLGRREAQRRDARARAPVGRGNRGAARGAPRPLRPARGAAVGAPGPRGREPVVRGGVRTDGRGSIRSPISRPRSSRARCKASSPPGSTDSTPRTSPCCRTPRWWARPSGSERSPRSAGASEPISSDGSTSSNAGASSAGRAVPRSAERPSTRSSISWSETWRTDRSRAARGGRSTARRRPGSGRSAAIAWRTGRSCSPTTTGPRSS